MSVVDVSDLVTALLGRFMFAGVERDAVESLLSHCEERRLAAGEVVLKERTHGDEMYILAHGRVHLTRLDHRGEPIALATRHAPDIIGALSLIDNALRSATVVADGDIVLRVVPRGLYASLWNAPTIAGSALRRLLLAALHEQLSQAHLAWTGHSRPEARAVTLPSGAFAAIGTQDEVDDDLIFGLKRDITEGGDEPG